MDKKTTFSIYRSRKEFMANIQDELDLLARALSDKFQKKLSIKVDANDDGEQIYFICEE